MKRISILIGLGIVVLAGFIGYPRIKQFFEIESCLDKGGRWNYELGSCEFAIDTSDEQEPELEDLAVNNISTDNFPTELEIQETFPEYVKQTMHNLPDSILIDVDNVIYGDFDGDGQQDFSSIVTNLKDGQTGIIIIEHSNTNQYLIFGAGVEINGMTNLSWVEVFQTLPIGKVIAPTLVDSESGDIIGPDASKEFKLIGNGIYLTVEEGHGGGIMFWNGTKYVWYHVE
ncbi:MAG: hypothetical protein AAFX87_30305 [Bacteroidota bacterium]